MSGAISLTNGRYTLPDKATKDDKYKCLCCAEVLVLRQGEIKRYHFAHKGCKGSSTERLTNTTGESISHITAKDMLVNALNTKRKVIITQRCWRCDCVRTHPITDVLYASTEYALEDGGRADVGVLHTDNSLTILEVLKTHKTTHRIGTWYEIHASEVIQKFNDETILLRCVRSWRCDECIEKDRLEKLENERKERLRVAECLRIQELRRIAQLEEAERNKLIAVINKVMKRRREERQERDRKRRFAKYQAEWDERCRIQEQERQEMLRIQAEEQKQRQIEWEEEEARRKAYRDEQARLKQIEDDEFQRKYLEEKALNPRPIRIKHKGRYKRTYDPKSHKITDYL